MKQWFRLTLVCGALVGLLLGLTQVVGLNYLSPVVGSGQCFIEGQNPRPTCPQFRFLEAWNSIWLALDLLNLLSSTVP